MSEERKRILQMLSEGKISAEEAEDLLTAVDGDQTKAVTQKEARFLRVKVWEDGKDKVNVNIPLSLARLGMKFIPAEAKAKMSDNQVDLDAIIREIQHGGTAGKIVEIDDDGTKVEVFID